MRDDESQFVREPKFCVNCKHYSKRNHLHLCGHPAFATSNTTTDKGFYVETMYMRSPCGDRGRYGSLFTEKD